MSAACIPHERRASEAAERGVHGMSNQKVEKRIEAQHDAERPVPTASSHPHVQGIHVCQQRSREPSIHLLFARLASSMRFVLHPLLRLQRSSSHIVSPAAPSTMATALQYARKRKQQFSDKQ